MTETELSARRLRMLPTRREVPSAVLKSADMPTQPGVPTAIEWRLAAWDSVLGPSKTDVNARPKTVAELEKDCEWWADESDDSEETRASEESGDGAAGESADAVRALEPELEPQPQPQPHPFAELKDDDAALVSKMAQLREEFTRGLLKEAEFVAAHLQLAVQVARPGGEEERMREVDCDRERELRAAETLATVEAMRKLECAQTAENVKAILAAAPAGVLSHSLPRHEAWKHTMGGGQRLLHHAAACGSSLEVLSAVLTACPAAASVTDGNGRHPLHWAAASTPSAETLRLLLAAAPDAASVSDYDGMLPAQLAMESAGAQSY